MLLLHAGVSDRRSWRHVVGRLCPGYRCVALDARGYGETRYSREDGWSPVEDALAVLDAAGLQRPVLVACSMGGQAAVDLTLGHPERVAGLVLIGSAIRGAPYPEVVDGPEAELTRALEAAEEAGDIDEVNRLEAWMWLDGPTATEGRVRGEPRELFLEMNGRALRAPDPGGQAQPPDAWSRLSEIAVPTLIYPSSRPTRPRCMRSRRSWLRATRGERTATRCPPVCRTGSARVAAVRATLYWFPMSHPALAARKMLELKGVSFRSVRILPGTQRSYLRLVGFDRGTVPALVLDGRHIQGSRAIARTLEDLIPEPALFPDDEAQRAHVEAVERWGEQELQNVPRIVFRWGLVNDLALRRWFGEDAGFPIPALAARVSGPVARYYQRLSGADEPTARAAVVRLEAMLDRVDALLADGTLSVAAPNAATLQVLSTVRALHAFTDLHAAVDLHPAAQAAREVFPEYPGPVPRFIPRAWLDAIAR